MPELTPSMLFWIPKERASGASEVEVARRHGLTEADVRKICAASEETGPGSWNDYVAAVTRRYA